MKTLHRCTPDSFDDQLFSLLRNRKIEEAGLAYSHPTQLPNSTCPSCLVPQLSYQNTLSSLMCVQSIIMCVRNERQLHRLDATCLNFLVVFVTKVNHTLYVASLLRSSYLPPRQDLDTVVARLASSPDLHDGPTEALCEKWDQKGKTESESDSMKMETAHGRRVIV
ncbi:Pentatricopeptide repeat-containing protein, chloroplastic [Glycine soja]